VARVTVGRTLAYVALILAIASVALLLVSGPGARVGLWHFRTGLGFLRWILYGGIGAAVIGFVSAALGGARMVSLAAIVLGVGALSVPILFRRTATALPRIHDITTDTQDPPRFDAVLPLRAGADNPPEYPGAEAAAQQQAAYPDVRPRVLADPPARAFERALAAVNGLGWSLVASQPEKGTIEATDTTFWYGFKDDVVIRIRPEGAGSRVDVRSKSRVGRSDIGANARRIRRFLDALGQ
jgi:uncharacterized protein (DUF1499 family)